MIESGPENFLKKRPNGISYSISYNILNDDYNIKYSEECINKNINNVTICSNGNEILKSINDVEIIQNNETKDIIVNVKNNRKRGRYNILTNLSLELYEDNSLKSADLSTISTRDGDQDLKKYTFKINEDSFKALYSDNDSNIIDITKNPRLLEMAIALITGGNEVLTHDFKIISEFLKNFLKTAKEYIYKKDITVNDFKYNFNTVEEVDKCIVCTIKNIKNEIPLKGFIERFDNSLLSLKMDKKSESKSYEYRR